MTSIALILLLAAAPAAFAHDPGLSGIVVEPDGAGLAVTVRVNRVDLRLAGRDDPQALRAMAPAALAVSLDGHAVAAGATDVRFEEAHAEARVLYPEANGQQLVLRSGWFEELAFGHKQLVRLVGDDGAVLAERLLGAGAPVFEAVVHARGDGTHGFVRLGVEHILAGWDHLLFLLTVLVVCRGLADVVRAVSAFTVAHSCTLLLATLGWVRLPASIVEPAIAASILVTAVLNLVGGVRARERFALAFVFGLVHGLGFAGALADLGDAGGWALWRSVVAFNVGVEAGQLAVAAAVLPLCWRLGRSPAYGGMALRGCSVAAAAMGLGWFVERTVL
jgi:hydrogenase/urease accessory protein HupE